ncbi:hypothetical protein VTO42DRAFT_3179 [Malbranchea cinnamomea]
MSKTVLAFDVYGTLLSTESVATRLAEHFGQDAGKSITASWRRYQLEYTWRLNSIGKYDAFSNVTRNALTHAVAEQGLVLTQEDTSEIMDAYDHLSTFHEVCTALDKLATHGKLKPVIFSNGTPDMLTKAVSSLRQCFQSVCLQSGDLEPHEEIFEEIISVDSVKKFKPAPEVYEYLAERVGKDKNDKAQMGDIWLISGNPFDVTGALSVGLKAAWVDRAGKGWIDAMNPQLRPTLVGKDLNEVIDAIIDKAGR